MKSVKREAVKNGFQSSSNVIDKIKHVNCLILKGYNQGSMKMDIIQNVWFMTFNLITFMFGYE